MATAESPPAAPRSAYRHRLPTRLWHWLNVLAFTLLLMSGLQIFNAHPALYWGEAGSDPKRAALQIGARAEQGALQGFTRIGDVEFRTTGVLGVSPGMQGAPEARAFPAWATVPGFRGLSVARRWHFFFAWLFVINLAVFMAFSLGNGHFRRDLLPKRSELSPRYLVHEIWNHMRLRFPKGEAALRYNILQLLAYASVIFLALPMMVLTGLTMSPSFNATAPWLLDLFGGRQSARTLHFIAASYLVLFVIVHLLSLLAVGVWNELRSMITGRFIVHPDKGANP